MDSKNLTIKSNPEDLRTFFYTDNFVREDKSLKEISKLIFGDIAYFQFLRNGKCTASNGHFAERYDKSKGTISKAISALVAKGYIVSYLDENRNRTIYVKRSKFASDQSNEETINENSHSENSVKRNEDNILMGSKSSSTGPDKHPVDPSIRNDTWIDISTIINHNATGDKNSGESNSPSGPKVGDIKPIMLSKTQMEDLVNKTLKNE